MPVRQSKTARGKAQDRKLVASGQEHEVAYVAEKARVPASTARKAAKKAGPSRAKVEAELKKDR